MTSFAFKPALAAGTSLACTSTTYTPIKCATLPFYRKGKEKNRYGNFNHNAANETQNCTQTKRYYGQIVSKVLSLKIAESGIRKKVAGDRIVRGKNSRVNTYQLTF